MRWDVINEKEKKEGGWEKIEREKERGGVPRSFPIGRNYSIPYYLHIGNFVASCSTTDEVHKRINMFTRESYFTAIYHRVREREPTFAQTRWFLKRQNTFTESEVRLHTFNIRTLYSPKCDQDYPVCDTEILIICYFNKCTLIYIYIKKNYSYIKILINAYKKHVYIYLLYLFAPCKIIVKNLDDRVVYVYEIFLLLELD